MSDFSGKIKILRLQNRLTQEEVAVGIGVAKNQYQFYEYGKREPSMLYIKRHCQFFNVSADFLLGLTDIQTPLTADDNPEINTSPPPAPDAEPGDPTLPRKEPKDE